MLMQVSRLLARLSLLPALCWPLSGVAQSDPITTEHYVANVSMAPAMAGEVAQIYVRERVLADADIGESTWCCLYMAPNPAEVAFDVPAGNYSWMAAHWRAPASIPLPWIPPAMAAPPDPIQ
ncbi:MAG: hypothetical protein ACE37N_15750 [Pseudohongiellaceae bacterium]